MRAMEGPFKPTAPSRPPRGAEAANRCAITSLVLGMTSIVLLAVFVIGFVGSLDEAELDAWIPILFLITLVTAISALVYGIRGRRLATDRSVRVRATIGVAFPTVFLVLLIIGVVLTMIILSIVASHDYL